MVPAGQSGGGGGSNSSPSRATPEGMRGWIRGAYRFATDRNDFRSYDDMNLIVNLGLFAVGVWIARNLTDVDLMAPVCWIADDGKEMSA